MRLSALALSTLLVSVGVVFPVRVWACTCATKPISHSQPANDSTDVPMDIAPMLEGPFDPTTIGFADERGVELEFELVQGPRVGCLGAWAELLPKQPLRANTRYTIRVGALDPVGLPASERVDMLTFTTGAAPTPDEEIAPPQLTAASVLRGAPVCGGRPENVTCIAGLEQPDPADLELIARRGDEILLRISSFIGEGGNYITEEAPDCIELRRRAPNGRRSEPVRICGEELLVRDYREGDLDENDWVTCEEGVLREPDESGHRPDAGPPEGDAHSSRAPGGGCHVAADVRGDLMQVVLLALSLLAWCFRRRRSCARRPALGVKQAPMLRTTVGSSPKLGSHG